MSSTVSLTGSQETASPALRRSRVASAVTERTRSIARRRAMVSPVTARFPHC